VETVKIPQNIKSFNPDEFDFNDIDKVKALFGQLLNFIELQAKAIEKLKQENQQLKDEIQRLKGEKGKPSFKPNVPNYDVLPGFRKAAKKWKKKGKKADIKIDRVEKVQINQGVLPSDAVFKGYRSVTVQNIKFITDNVEYLIERYYSPSEKKTYEAVLPKCVDGEFGPDLKAYIHSQYFSCRVTENKILRALLEMDVKISKGQISNIITLSKSKEFKKEKEDIFITGMNSSDYFHIDDTGARHKSINHYVQVICNHLFSSFFIIRRKNRDTLRDILGILENEKLDKIMMSDDAKQFMYLTLYQALCWIHEIRHYRKMNPYLDWHEEKLKTFLQTIYDFYEQLKKYKTHPTTTQKKILEK